MRLHRRLTAALFCVLLTIQAYPASRKALEKRISTILSTPDLTRGFWGMEVVSLSTGKVLYSQNGDKLFIPASNTKLFTTAAALALIGSDYKFRTSVETNGVLDKHGRLTGDLVLIGRGDPNLSGRELPYDLHTERNDHPIQVLENLADTLVQKGVKYVDGDIVADDSYFAFERYGEGWSQDDLVWGDGAPVSALTINDNVVFVSILPADRAGDRAFVSVLPFADYYQIDNRIITTPQGTGGRKIFINREPGSRLLMLWGNVPVDDPGANEALAIEDPADYASQLFRNLLERRGVVVYGRVRAHHTELANLATLSVTSLASARGGGDTSQPSSPQPLVLATYASQPLSEDLRVINKVSQNLHAELLLRLLGRENRFPEPRQCAFRLCDYTQRRAPGFFSDVEQSSSPAQARAGHDRSNRAGHRRRQITFAIWERGPVAAWMQWLRVPDQCSWAACACLPTILSTRRHYCGQDVWRRTAELASCARETGYRVAPKLQ